MKLYLRLAVIAVMVLLALPLAGCGEEAADLRDGYVKSLEIDSSRAGGDFAVRNNVPLEEMNEELGLIFSVLEKGFSMEMDMESYSSMRILLSSYAEDSLREEGIWPYEESLDAEFFVSEGRTAFKTAADPSYLLIDPADASLIMPGEGAEMDALFDETYSEEQVELMLNFLAPFMSEFDYTLSDVERLEAEELELPDETIEAEVIKMNLEYEEILGLIAYTCRELADSDHFKEYLVSSIMGPIEKMMEEDMIPEEQQLSKEEMEQMAEDSFEQFSAILLQVAEAAESPTLLQEQYGLDLTGEAYYYLDDDGYIRKTVEEFRIKAEHEALEQLLGTSKLDLEFEAESYLWDINEPVDVDFPSSEETVSLYALMADPELAAELGDGPLHCLYEWFSVAVPPTPEPPEVREPVIEEKHLLLDLAEENFLLDGEAITMEVLPYMEDDVLMVPLRQLGEIAGAEISWDPEERQVRYEDEEQVILITVGSSEFQVNGEGMELDESVTIREGRTMVPAELIEQFSQQMYVDNGTALFVFD